MNQVKLNRNQKIPLIVSQYFVGLVHPKHWRTDFDGIGV